ncbi:MAG: hypothetical protein BJ554DRAFT_491 [Olpidium bornovanus]|uniref:Uncharacterized protein n=1 Tax=Olpidium bornovanus TaxID=278681 RepID=A0A8H8DII9_9FUNG|nr:MAG: hypothetical protein BJ554DRAFT_491 [Olpidium bornovanus]
MPLFGDIGSTLEKELKAEEQAAPPEQRGKQRTSPFNARGTLIPICGETNDVVPLPPSFFPFSPGSAVVREKRQHSQVSGVRAREARKETIPATEEGTAG